MRLEDARQHIAGDAVAVVADDDRHPRLGSTILVFFRSRTVCRHGNRDLARAGESSVLEHVEEDFAELVTKRQRRDGAVGTLELPADRILATAALSHGLEADDISHDGRNVRRLGRSSLVRRGPVPAEGARDLVEPVDLGENPIHVLLEHAIEVHTPVGAGAA